MPHLLEVVGKKASLVGKLRGLREAEITIDLRYKVLPKGRDLIEMGFGNYRFMVDTWLIAGNPDEAHLVLSTEANLLNKFLKGVYLDIDYKGYYVCNGKEEILGSLVES